MEDSFDFQKHEKSKLGMLLNSRKNIIHKVLIKQWSSKLFPRQRYQEISKKSDQRMLSWSQYLSFCRRVGPLQMYFPMIIHKGPMANSEIGPLYFRADWNKEGKRYCYGLALRNLRFYLLTSHRQRIYPVGPTCIRYLTRVFPHLRWVPGASASANECRVPRLCCIFRHWELWIRRWLCYPGYFLVAHICLS